MPTNEGLYKLSYDIHAEPITAEEALAQGRGAADDLVIISIVREAGASFDLLMSVNGDTGEELTGIELFKRWVNMAARLEDEDLPVWQQWLVKVAIETVRFHMKAGKA